MHNYLTTITTIEIYSGHCIALVDNNQNLDSSSREEQMETNSQNKTCDAVENSSPACEKCVEEGNNRLSFLMESANEVMFHILLNC